MGKQAKILPIKGVTQQPAAKSCSLAKEDEKLLDLMAQAIAKHIISKAYEKRHPVPANQQREAI